MRTIGTHSSSRAGGRSSAVLPAPAPEAAGVAEGAELGDATAPVGNVAAEATPSQGPSPASADADLQRRER